MTERDCSGSLREPSEASITSERLDFPEGTGHATQRWLHELWMRQAELQTQNETLQRLTAELEQSRHQFSQWFHQAPMGYVILNPVGLIHEANDRFCRMIGQPRAQLIGTPFVEHLEAQHRERFLERYRVLLHGLAGNTLEAQLRRTDGSACYVQIEGSRLDAPLHSTHEPEEPALALAVMDITERKEAETQRLRIEQQLQQRQKLESLGVLAGGVAHDFNNLLTIILGNASLALDELPPRSPTRDSLWAIEKTALRAAELCRQMLAYSGKGQFIIEPIRLNELVGEMIPLFKASMAKKIRLNLNFDEGLVPLRGDPSQIRQMVMNLVINAAEAIGEHPGVITLSTGVMKGSNEDFNAVNADAALATGESVWLEVSDTGCGMEPQVRQRMFEPFFTTKFTGRGLGLSAVLGIVRGHQGTLQVDSQPNRGTTFRVLFPAVPAGSHPTWPIRAPLHEWQGVGTVLLVDDEDAVRTLGARMLEQIGFQVLAVSDGEVALELYRARQGEIVLVLLDSIMPGMDGEETFHHLRHIDPQVRVVMVSSYAEITPRSSTEHQRRFLQKPYTFDALTACLREALGD